MADNTKKEKKSFLKGLKAELKKVIWPTSKQVANNTMTVIVVVLVVISIVVVLDLGLEKIREFGAEKINTVISSKEQQNVSENLSEDIIIEPQENIEVSTEADTTNTQTNNESSDVEAE